MARISSPTLIGRNEQLERALAVASVPPSLLIIEGEAGVGKTRLVAELLSRSETAGMNRLVGACVHLREPVPLAPVAEALRRSDELPLTALSPLAGAIRDLLPELSDRLPPPLESTGEPAEDRFRLFSALSELLDAMGPTILAMEDLHWADESTLDFLTLLMAAWPPRLGLVLTVRADELPEKSKLRQVIARPPYGLSVDRVQLDPLDTTETGRLAAAIVGVEDVSEEFALYLHERTAGLPFAVEELVQLMLERRDLSRGETGWVRKPLDRLEVPAAVRDLVLGRFGRLSANARLLVQTAAALGIDTDEETMFSVSELGEEEASWSLGEALRTGLLMERDGRFRFRHSLARQAIHDDIVEPQRRRLHLRCALLYEGSSPKPLAKLAYHYREAGRAPDFVRCASEAAAVASGAGDHQLAFDLLRDALATPEADGEQRHELAVRLGEAALACLACEEAIPIIRSVLEQGGWSEHAEGLLRIQLARLLHEVGDMQPAKAECERAFPLLADRAPDLGARVAAMFAVPPLPETTRGDHLMWLTRAESLAPACREIATQLSLRFDALVVRRHLGEPVPPNAFEALPRSSTDARELYEIVRGFSNLAFASLDTGHDQEAAAAVDVGLALCGSNERFRRSLIASQLRLDLLGGRWKGLEVRIRQALAATPGYMSEHLELELILAQLLLARGRVRESGQLFEAVHAAALEGDIIQVLAASANGLASVRSSSDRRDEAIGLLRSVWDVLSANDLLLWSSPIAPALVMGLVDQGEIAEARSLVEDLGVVADLDAPAVAAAHAASEAILLSVEANAQADRGFEAAVRAWKEMPRPYEASLVEEAWASRRAADRVVHLTAALEGFERIGATWDATRVARSLRVAGAPVYRGRRGRKSYGRRLSPRELEVVELIGLGCTNEEIARRLFVSPKTVERHVQNAMRKTSTSSRAALAVAVSSGEAALPERVETP